MGCDIHAYIEVKNYEGEWEMVVDCDMFPAGKTDITGRDYRLFAALAGVRGDGPDPNGLPRSLSPQVQKVYKSWGDDAHSASWYSLREFAEIYENYSRGFSQRIAKKMLGEEDGETAVERVFGRLYSPDDYRVVFWFDN